MAPLPAVDTHEIVLDADADAAWAAVCQTMAAKPSWLARLGARALGCRDVRPGGPRPLAAGSIVCGFRVARAAPPRELALEGGHRFSEYTLTFRIGAAGAGRSRVSAETRAAFPGATGRAYRAAVIGTGGHRLAMAGLLRGIRRRAAVNERAPRR